MKTSIRTQRRGKKTSPNSKGCRMKPDLPQKTKFVAYLPQPYKQCTPHFHHLPRLTAMGHLSPSHRLRSGWKVLHDLSSSAVSLQFAPSYSTLCNLIVCTLARKTFNNRS